MKVNKKFYRAAQYRKLKAVVVTIIFHVLLLTAITYGTGGELNRFIPEVVKQWFIPSPTEQPTKETA